MRQASAEIERINEVYAARKQNIDNHRYSMMNRAHRFMLLDLENQIFQRFSEQFLSIGEEDTWLDVGCGSGYWLSTFQRYGLKAKNSHGIDAIEDRIRNAKELYPNVSFKVGDARSLPYDTGTFSFVSQFTMLSSVLDPKDREAIADEIVRVTKPGGIIISYDFFWPNPSNKNVTPINKEELKRLFRGCEVSDRKVTLAPPITRAMAPHSIILCELLGLCPLLRTHFLSFMRKVGG